VFGSSKGTPQTLTFPSTSQNLCQHSNIHAKNYTGGPHTQLRNVIDPSQTQKRAKLEDVIIRSFSYISIIYYNPGI